MIILTIGNSYSKIEGLTREANKEVRELLSYTVDAGYNAGGYRSNKRCLLSKHGEFPTGLMPYVDKWLQLQQANATGDDYTVKDSRRRPKGSTAMFSLDLASQAIKPYKEQLDAVQVAYRANRGTISMVTGFGKSLTMALLINRLQLRALVIVPNLTLKTQLQATFRQLFGSLHNITIENIDSKALQTATDYDVLIIDESHHVAASTYRKLNKKCWNNIYHRYFFTGTAFRSKDEEQMLMESISGDVIYSVDYHRAVEAGAIVPIQAYYFELPKVKVEGYTWREVYNELIVNNGYRNLVIRQLILQLKSVGIPTLCLVKELKHGDTLSDLTGCGFASGINDETQMLVNGFNSKKLTALIGTSGVLGEGVDTKPAEYIIIAGLGKSRNAFIQQIGRGLRKASGKCSAKIILFSDKSHKWTKAHFNAQVKILKEVYGVTPVQLPLPDLFDK